MQPDGFSFSVAPEVLALGVRGAYFTLIGVTNLPTDESFSNYRDSVLREILPRYQNDAFIKADPVLEGFRQIHTRIGRSNRRFPSAPEGLISRFLRTKDLPAINLAVDIYNLVSVRTRLALGAHDIDRIDGGVCLRMTNGSERFVPLGATAPEPVSAGEYAYIDGSNEIICRMEVVQVEKTKVTTASKNMFYIVQGNASTPPASIQSAMEELIEVTQRFCGGTATIVFQSE